jgi:hypothetical protein
MKKPFPLSAVIILALATACSPRVVTKLYHPSIYREYSGEEVQVFDINQEVPVNAEELGSIKIQNNGFSTHCKRSSSRSCKIGS